MKGSFDGYDYLSQASLEAQRMKEILTIRVFDEVDDEIASLEIDYRPIPRDGSVKYILRLTPDMADELGVDELHVMLQRDTVVVPSLV